MGCCSQCDKSYPKEDADATALVQVESTKKKIDNHKCKVMCQRFGMKALGKDFAQIKNPTECCSQCDKSYPKEDADAPALVQVESTKKKIDNHECKVMCQRFGVKALGKDFAQIKN